MESTKFELKAIPPFDFISTITQWGVHPPLEYIVEGIYYNVIRLPSDKLVTVLMCSKGRIDRPLIEVIVKSKEALSEEEKDIIQDEIR